MTQIDAIVCQACGDQKIVGISEKIALLRKSGKLRRSNDPDPAIIDALMTDALSGAACRRCGKPGLRLQAVADEEDPDVWDEPRHCGGCGKAISAERLEVFPDAQRCAACQQAYQSGADDPQEYCPRCGNPMTLQTTRGAGLARYQSRCGACGYRG